MDPHEEKLKRFILENGIRAEHSHFEESCHSVAEAAHAVGATPDTFVKNICMIDPRGNLIVAIVKGEDQVDLKLVGDALGGAKPRIATAEEILIKTGYPCGGTPSFGYQARFLIDERVMVAHGFVSPRRECRCASGQVNRSGGSENTDREMPGKRRLA